MKKTYLALVLIGAMPLLAHAEKEMAFAPSYLTMEGDKQPELKQWRDAKSCKGCHPRQWKGWQGSMHSIAFIDPVFQAEWAMGEKETNGAAKNLCGGCHTVLGTVTQTVEFKSESGKFGGFTTQAIANQGVSCEVCHSVVDTNAKHTAMGEHGNASLVIANDKVKRGPFDDAKPRGHKAEYSELHTKSEFCANCHNVFNPVHDNFALEHTYDEWKKSAYAAADIQCQDCHMVPVETAMRVADEMLPAKKLTNHGLEGKAARGGPARTLVHDHGFVGGNAVIAPLLGVENGEAHAKEAVKRLKTAAALETKVSGTIAAPVLEVTVHNRRAGHDLPTSLTFIRQIWLEVIIRDNTGKEIMRSGSLTAENALPGGTVIFQDKSVDIHGKPEHKPWKVASFEVQNTIPAKGSKTVTYPFSLPKGVNEYSIETKLHYRSFDQSVADLLLENKVIVPSVEMASLSQTYQGLTLN
ncbi:cytochrome c family protein [Shewanella sp. MBTL60-007]|uniref:cytochrome c family protein n=1 Tax=Shewanella sp. MBTL60-007 TaxID=2815911 RepID=UPI001BBCC4E0|nr:cytochrome c family protein [Shewanella sp. MBTL60-007]GIU29550.1 cytochrome c [Shewanella sp. MBTL60-007]